MTQVEKVARAMWLDCQWNPYMPYFAHDTAWEDEWPGDYDWMREMIRSQARAAIRAMSEPSEGMVEAAPSGGSWEVGRNGTPMYVPTLSGGPADIYRAMILAALEE